MPRKLTDAQVAQIHDLSAGGVSRREIAERFGVSQEHVGRLLRGTRRQRIGPLDAKTAARSTVAALDKFLIGLELGPAELVQAETARALAEKLDACRVSDSGVAAQATPGLAKQFLDVLEELRDSERELDAIDMLQIRRQARRLAATGR